MFSAFRSSAQGPALRRIIALVLTLCTVLAFFEPTLADSCDSRADSASSLVGTALTGTWTNTSDASIPGTNLDGHLFHVCHCAHGHGATKLTDEVSLVSSLKFFESLIDWSERTPVSAHQDLKLRPPRA